MSIQYLKKGIAEQERSAENEKVKNIVEETLKKIELQGDQYIRELSEKFDNYSPPRKIDLNINSNKVKKFLYLYFPKKCKMA